MVGTTTWIQEVCSGATVCGPALKTCFRTATRTYTRKDMRQQAVPAALCYYHMRAPVFSPRVIIASILLWERFLVIKAVRVRSLWRSCLSNIAVVAATPYPRLREPVNRLADPSNDESTYPVVDWVNSSIQAISSQAKYHFTFSYHQIMNSNTAPKQWSLTKNETITTFEGWRQNLQYSLSLDANFAPFLADTFTWLKKSSTAPTRGLESDGDDVPTTRRRNAFQKNLHLDLMLGQIANFCPVISRSSIVKNSTSISSVWQAIRAHYGFQSTGARFHGSVEPWKLYPSTLRSNDLRPP